MGSIQDQSREYLFEIVEAINEHQNIKAHIKVADLHLVIGEYHYSIFPTQGETLSVHKDMRH